MGVVRMLRLCKSRPHPPRLLLPLRLVPRNTGTRSGHGNFHVAGQLVRRGDLPATATISADDSTQVVTAPRRQRGKTFCPAQLTLSIDQTPPRSCNSPPPSQLALAKRHRHRQRRDISASRPVDSVEWSTVATLPRAVTHDLTGPTTANAAIPYFSPASVFDAAGNVKVGVADSGCACWPCYRSVFPTPAIPSLVHGQCSCTAKTPRTIRRYFTSPLQRASFLSISSLQHDHRRARNGFRGT